MTIWSPNDIAGLIYLVGNWGPGSKAKAPEFLDTAIAVCLAESGGDEMATNPKVPKDLHFAVGLWQIMFDAHEDLLNKYGKEYANTPGTTKAAYHPLVNTATARDIQQAQGWTPWAAYTSGAYKQHLGHGATAYAYISKRENMAALQAKMANYGMNSSGAKFDTGTSWQDILKALPQYMVDRAKEMGVTVGVFLVGLVLVILGVWFLISQNADKVAKYTPQGAAIKAVTKTVLKK